MCEHSHTCVLSTRYHARKQRVGLVAWAHCCAVPTIDKEQHTTAHTPSSAIYARNLQVCEFSQVLDGTI
jgi:hypothetical protein